MLMLKTILAISIVNGHGVTQDYAKARHFYELAAEQGHAGAQYNLGYLYDQWSWRNARLRKGSTFLRACSRAR